MDCSMNPQLGLIEQCYGLVLKISRSILLMQKATKFADEDVCPELCILFKEQNSNGISQCTDIEVNYQTPEPSTLEIRSFIRSLSDRKELITVLQMQANGACLCVTHAVDSVIRVYNLYLSPETGEWKLSWREVEKEPGSEEKFFLLVTVEVNACGNLHQLRSACLSFLKKCQVLRPHLSISCKALGSNFHRMGVPGLQPGSLWKDNFLNYLRLASPKATYLATKQQKKVLQGPGESPVSISLLYSRVPTTGIGTKNHLHILIYDEEGFPLPVGSNVWDSHIQIVPPKDVQMSRNLDTCAAYVDVCYTLGLQGSAPECYVLALILSGTSDVDSVVSRHGPAVGYAVREALINMMKIGKQEEEDRKWCHQVANCIGEFLRFSLNDEFRENCLGMLQASNANDFEEKLEARLFGWCVEPSAQPPPDTVQRLGNKRTRSGQPKVMSSSAPACVTVASSSAAAGLPDGLQSASNSRSGGNDWLVPAEDVVEEDESDEERKRARIFEEWSNLGSASSTAFV